MDSVLVCVPDLSAPAISPGFGTNCLSNVSRYSSNAPVGDKHKRVRFSLRLRLTLFRERNIGYAST